MGRATNDSARSLAALGIAAVASLTTACGIPRDPDKTLDRIRGGTMRVGVVANPPWVTDSAGVVGGIEGQLVGELARGLGAQPVWVRAAETELMAALKEREIDLVIGGLTDASPYKMEVAFTKPYYTDTIVVGLPPGQAPGRGIQGTSVAVDARDADLAGYLRKHKAQPLLVDDITRATTAVAAPSWQLQALGRRPAPDITLAEARHVLAASTGENAWLVRVEQLLHERKSTIPGALRASATTAAHP